MEPPLLTAKLPPLRSRLMVLSTVDTSCLTCAAWEEEPAEAQPVEPVALS